MNKRYKSLQRYDISKKRYKELCGFVEQYPEWKAALMDLEPTVRGQAYDGVPSGKTNGTYDATAELAIKRSAFSDKVGLVERAAQEADADFWHFIILNACYELPYHYLQTHYGLPLSERAFFDRRRYFFYVLSLSR